MVFGFQTYQNDMTFCANTLILNSKIYLNFGTLRSVDCTSINLSYVKLSDVSCREDPFTIPIIVRSLRASTHITQFDIVCVRHDLIS